MTLTTKLFMQCFSSFAPLDYSGLLRLLISVQPSSPSWASQFSHHQNNPIPSFQLPIFACSSLTHSPTVFTRGISGFYTMNILAFPTVAQLLGTGHSYLFNIMHSTIDQNCSLNVM